MTMQQFECTGLIIVCRPARVSAKIPKYKKHNYKKKKLIEEENKLTNCDESNRIKLLRSSLRS